MASFQHAPQIAGQSRCSHPDLAISVRPVPLRKARQRGGCSAAQGVTRSRTSIITNNSSMCSSNNDCNSIGSGKRHLLLASLAAALVSQQLPVQATEEQQAAADAGAAPAADSQSTSDAGNKVFLDVRIDGEAAGRIVIALWPEVTAGATRFRELAVGGKGVDYKRSKFNGVYPTFIENDGVKNLSYSATEVSPITGGDSIQLLEEELASQKRRHDAAGIVSLIVGETVERPIQEKLVAYGGQFRTVKIQAGEAPNGTGFTITTAADRALDRTHLMVGQVVEGMDIVQRIAALPINKPRDDNPYFRLGKAMGDKRAVTAENGFYRPFKKVVVSASGLLS